MGKKAEQIEQRVIEEAKYIIDSKQTVRQTAEIFKVSKSTVHKDVAIRLKYIDLKLYDEVKQVLKTNGDEKYKRGGKATKDLWKRIRENNVL